MEIWKRENGGQLTKGNMEHQRQEKTRNGTLEMIKGKLSELKRSNLTKGDMNKGDEKWNFRDKKMEL